MICIDFSQHWPRLVLALGMVVAGQHAGAQPNRRLPEKKTTSPSPAPAPSNQLSALKTEEALRMLLRADSVASQRQRAKLGPESSGLVIDQTITKIGHDFYDQFYSRWEAPAGIGDFTIAVGEKPARGNNAIITLTVNDEQLLEFPLQGKEEMISDASQQAIEIAANSLQQAFNLSQQLERGNKQALETY
ncbi:CsgE family curli-type amyloid fiber assembly protein [Hymenobacter sp. M29]|uniref:Curli production assembly/transport component CsgE n=1 Tax=Hymenobacter mellowenesis TaxID=3063995 RepID=A0ABT9ADH9_9BACT|nr:CsgE family curli-type amyloid fiber assembly protein [Hymenobacter sp. M29]MDO7847891.1 CsgE family curli-type amyloid fiber assembly protein [Hymenobacter sp. M29]